MDMISDKIRNMADEIRTQIVQDRRYLHQIPEIGMDLPETSAYIKKRLRWRRGRIPWKECGGKVPEKVTEDFMQAGSPRLPPPPRSDSGHRTRKSLHPSEG